jgi:hypothetical protein
VDVHRLVAENFAKSLHDPQDWRYRTLLRNQHEPPAGRALAGAD